MKISSVGTLAALLAVQKASASVTNLNRINMTGLTIDSGSLKTASPTQATMTTSVQTSRAVAGTGLASLSGFRFPLLMGMTFLASPALISRVV